MASGRPQIVVSAILGAIEAGKYTVGDLLPPEVEIAASHDVSRATVRTALLELEGLGMISRKRGSGTRVLALKPVSASDGFSHSLGRFEDVVQYADTTRREVRTMKEVVADFDLALRLGCKPGSRWLHVEMVRVGEDQNGPTFICWTDLYAVGDFAALLQAELPDYAGAAIALIESRYGRQAREIHQSIRARSLSPAIASVAGTAAGKPALEITRRYLGQGENVVMVTFSQHPAEGFVYEMSLKRNGPV